MGETSDIQHKSKPTSTTTGHAQEVMVSMMLTQANTTRWNDDDLTLWPPNYSIWIFTHLKFRLADAIHNFKWVKII